MDWEDPVKKRSASVKQLCAGVLLCPFGCASIAMPQPFLLGCQQPLGLCLVGAVPRALCVNTDRQSLGQKEKNGKDLIKQESRNFRRQCTAFVIPNVLKAT